MEARVIPAAEALRLDVLGSENIIRVAGAHTSGSLMLLETRMPAGIGVPRHVHTREDEFFYVLEGEIEYEIGDRRLVAPPGTTLVGPRNTPHSYRAANNRAAAMLVTAMPAGLEHMFEELGKLPPGAADLQRVAQIVGRYGISFT